MANKIGHMFIWILCIGLDFDVILGASKDLRLGDGTGVAVSAEAAPASLSVVEGACKSRVDIFGYPCEEHTVFPP